MNMNENTSNFFETLNEVQKQNVMDKVNEIIKSSNDIQNKRELIESVARGMYRIIQG